MSALEIPADLLPADGRFGAGPSKVRDGQLDALAAAQPGLLGTSHRQSAVKSLVGGIREKLERFFSAPEGYEVVLGNGGATAFWDAAAFGLVERKAQHLSFGEFGAKFAKATDSAPFLEASDVISSEPGTRPVPRAAADVDAYAWPQNETSTGVVAEVSRVPGAEGTLHLTDATSAAGGVPVDLAQTDVYYFSPQKNFASDGGLWLALVSPSAVERIESIAASGRWIPDFLSLKTALDNSRKDQTYNTPALATLVTLDAQLDWFEQIGGLAGAAERTARSSGLVYAWAEQHELATPFVRRPEERSPVIATVDFDESVDAAALASTLRANGVLDVEPYRKLGRNQLRIATFAAIEPSDVAALLRCVDYVLERVR
ncbi:phosphoserine transaminase [Arthrobacter sp. UM1]|uniref:phosphoserine transaminase n=1 Tax=Arthrobacter sp. UM1 TaxID=2766776 RepID=UPI001CF616A6|nr:phosphoserine transaminase [Arthrobacter sp. UM1]MCB4207841.1 phosphoserine transaminase [Arthrobacter sp. UM1]